MKTRMEKYYNNERHLERTEKNKQLYNDTLSNIMPKSNVTLLDNASEIDISKLKQMINTRDDYKRVKKYHTIVDKKPERETDIRYDIYDDIESKIYDINTILETAKNNRQTIDGREKKRKLQNTQYNILSKLDLNQAHEDLSEGEMVSDFFTKDNNLSDMINTINNQNEEMLEETSSDLFDDLKKTSSTILTKPIKESDIKISKIETEKNNADDRAFYTGGLAFAQKDFDGFQNLQTTVKFNNKLIKILIMVLVAVLLVIIVYSFIILY